MKKISLVIILILSFSLFSGCVQLHPLSNPDKCELLDDKLNKDNCYQTVARTMARDMSYDINNITKVCDKVGTYGGKDECFFSSAVNRYLGLISMNSNSYMDVVNLCNEIKNKESKNECFIFLATETNTSAYCNYVENYYDTMNQEAMKMIFGNLTDRITQQEYCRNLTSMS